DDAKRGSRPPRSPSPVRGSLGRMNGSVQNLESRCLGRGQNPAREPPQPSILQAMATERQIHVGGVAIGGGAPVVVQSMTTTDTADVAATLRQIGELAEAGCEIARVAVPGRADADALPAVVAGSPLPVIADIHFNAS